MIAELQNVGIDWDQIVNTAATLDMEFARAMKSSSSQTTKMSMIGWSCCHMKRSVLARLCSDALLTVPWDFIALQVCESQCHDSLKTLKFSGSHVCVAGCGGNSI